MKYQPLSLLLLPFVILAAGCGGGGDDNSVAASPFTYSGTKSGTFTYYVGASATTPDASDVPVSGTISGDGTFRFVIDGFRGGDEVLTGKVDETGTVSSAVRTRATNGGTFGTMENGRGTLSRSGDSITFTLGFSGISNPNGPDYGDYRYVGTLN